MEQFRQIGEVLGSLRALIVLQDDNQINGRQCCLLFDIFTLAFNTIAEEIKQNLKLEEKKTKWKSLEQPLRELYRIFKGGEAYVKQCMERKDWWAKAINLHQNRDCVENHIHNLLSHFPIVIEALEMAGEIAGIDDGEMRRRRIALAMKYGKEWNEPKLFQLRFGKQYLIPRDICIRFETAWREDRWNLVEVLKEKKSYESVTKNEQRLAGLLTKKIIGSESYNGKLSPSSILYGGDYQVRRRLGAHYKEIQWLGESFVQGKFFVEMDPSSSEISSLLSFSHPNILQYLCGFYDEEKKEVLLVLELMNKDLSTYMKETCGSRRKVLFSIPVVVDLMLQIARGMEYLHSKKIYHGELNPNYIFLKARNNTEGFFHLKISGFGLSSVKTGSSPKPVESDPLIWYAPEVLLELEQEQPGNVTISKYTEKADVYSFGMICFELLTGKVPFEDGHLQGEKMSRNIIAGERPLFPYTAPKYLVNLTKRCWHTDPNQRPSFSSVCRILRYTNKFLVMNPDQPEKQCPVSDYCEIESWLQNKFAENGAFDSSSVAQIPFQMFAYRLAERDQSILNSKEESNIPVVEVPWITPSDTKYVVSDVKSVCSDVKSVCSDIFSEAPERRANNSPKKRSSSTKISEKKVLMMRNTHVSRKSLGTSLAQSPTLNGSRTAKISQENGSTLVTRSMGSIR